MKSEIVAQGMTAADLDKLALIADVQFNEPMGSAALNRKFYGIMPAGIYRGFMPVVRGGLKVSVGDSPVNVAAVDVDGFMISVQGRRPVELTVPTGRKVYCVIEANYAIGLRTTQVDMTASMKAADIRMINADELRGNHVIVFSANLPADATEIRADQLEIGERQEADIGSDAIDRHTKNYLNPHQVNKGQIGLSDVENYGVATLEEAKAGEAEHKYMTPATTAAAITEQAGAAVSSHTGNKNNPHGVTKAQVGLGKVNDYAVATAAEAQAGTATDKYMTPATTAAAITEQAGAAVSSHTGDKGNPHGVTKAQVGLGNADNTSDANKPVSTATRTELNKKADVYRWGAVVRKGVWSAIGHFGIEPEPVGQAEVTLAHTRGSVVVGVRCLISWGHAKKAAIVLLDGHDYTQVKLRLVNPDGSDHVRLEVFDSAVGDGDGIYTVVVNSLFGAVTPFTAFTASSGTPNVEITTEAGAIKIGNSKVFHQNFKPTLAELGAAPAGHGHGWGEISGIPVYATRWPTADEAGAVAKNTATYFNAPFMMRTSNYSDDTSMRDLNYAGFYRTNGSHLDGTGLPALMIHCPHSGGLAHARGIGFDYGGSGAGWGLYTYGFTADGVHKGISRVYHQQDKPTPAELGAAPASHGHGWGEISGIPVYAQRWPNAGEVGAMADGGTYGTVTLSNWIRTTGNSGIYFASYDGGLHMTDTTWIRTYSGKKFHVANGEADAINTSGGIYAGGNGNFNDVHIRSDRRLKSNFEPITNALEKVSQLYGQIYDKAGVREAGLIAQDVQAVQPESVHENKEGMLTIAPAGVVALLVEAVKELRSENIALKARLDQMGA